MISKKSIFTFTFLLIAILPIFSKGKGDYIELISKGTNGAIQKELIFSPSLKNSRLGKNYDSILMVALEKKREKKIINSILASGIDVDYKNKNGQTAVMYACKYSSDDILEKVIKADTAFSWQRKNRILEKDKEGKTSFDYATSSTEKILLKYAQKPNQTEKENTKDSTVNETASEPAPIENTTNATEPQTPVVSSETVATAPVVASAPAFSPEPIVAATVAVATSVAETTAASVSTTDVASSVVPVTDIVPAVVVAPVPIIVASDADVAPDAGVAPVVAKTTTTTVAPVPSKEPTQPKIDDESKARVAEKERDKVIENANIPEISEPYSAVYLFEGIDFSSNKTENQVKNTKEELKYNPNVKDKNGRTPLMIASSKDSVPLVKKLLEQGANPNASDSDGWTPLMYAIRYSGNINIVKSLIDSGASIVAKNNYGVNILMLTASFTKNPQILDVIIKETKPSVNSLHEAFITSIIQNKKTDIINVYLGKKVNVNYMFKGKTPLMYASLSNSSTEIIDLLLQNGANPKITTFDNKNAFFYASKNTNLPHNKVYWSLNVSQE